MIQKIFQSIFLTSLSIFVVTFLALFSVLSVYFTQLQEAQLDTALQFALVGIEEEGETYLNALDSDLSFTWKDSNGYVLVQDKAPTVSNAWMEKVMEKEVQLEDGSSLLVQGRFATTWLLMLSFSQPIGWMVIAMILLSYFVARKLSIHIMKPLNQMDMEHPTMHVYPELYPFVRKIQSQKQELKQRCKELEQANDTHATFTTNVSHELKTPLQTILGSAELIEQGIASQEDVPRFARRIIDQTHHLLDLVQDVLYISALDENQSASFEDVDVYRVCLNQVEHLQPLAQEKHITLHVHGQTTYIQGVERLFKDIVYNLVNNAIRYNHAYGRVDIFVEDKQICVQDDGPGIPEEDRDHIFERFYRGDKSHSQKIQGTGLGLSIVKHAVTYMHGTIDVQHNPTRFILSF